MRRDVAGLERAAEAMLRTLGADKASLLLTQPVAESALIGLGINAPPVAEMEMEPVLLQSTVDGKSLLAIATRSTVQKAINVGDTLQATELLCTSMLRAGGTQYRVVSVTVKRFGGAEMLYELEIEE